jgi:cytochrome P450
MTVDQALADDVGSLLAGDLETMADPWRVWNRLREEAPLFEHGPVVLVTRYDDVRTLYRDNANFSNEAARRGSAFDAIRAGLNGIEREALDSVTAFEAMYVSRTDPPQHARLRMIAHRIFTPRRIEELRRSIEGYTESMLSDAEAGTTVDLMPFAYRLPLMVISDLLGVPDADREKVHEWSGKLGANRLGAPPDVLLAAHAAQLEFREYVGGMVAEHRRGPAPSDLVAALMDAEGDRLSAEELTAMFVVLLFAGHETTTNLIAIGLDQLLRHPDEWRSLCEDRTLVGNAVEELLRVVSPVQWTRRVTTRQVAFADRVLPEGQTVFAVAAAANHDPRVFDEPDAVQIARPNAKDHVALGFGPHFCLGASLARLEGQIVFDALARRFPKAEPATDELQWRGAPSLRSPASLPVHLAS